MSPTAAMCKGGGAIADIRKDVGADFREDVGADSCAVVFALADAGSGSLSARNAGDPAAVAMLNTTKVVRTPIVERG